MRILALSLALAGVLTVLPRALETTEEEQIRRWTQDRQYDQAEAAARERLRWTAEEHGVDSLPYARAGELLVEVLFRANKTREPATRELAETVVSIKIKQLGEEDLELAASMRRLADVLYRGGLDLEAAKRHYQDALSIQERALGLEHRDLVPTLNGLANTIRRRSNDSVLARQHLERGLTILRQHEEVDDSWPAIVLDSLAIVEHAGGNLEACLSLQEDALAYREQLHGQDDPRLARSLRRVASTRYELGHYDEAEPLFLRALEIVESSFGPNSLEFAWVLNDYGNFKAEAGDLAASIGLLERYVGILDGVLGPDSLDAARGRHNLGLTLAEWGDLIQAREILEDALRVRIDALGPQHLRVADTLWGLASVQMQLRSWRQAEETYEQVLEIWQQSLVDDHYKLGQILDSLGAVHVNLHEFDKGRERLEQALAILEQNLGPDHQWVASPLQNLGIMFIRQGRYAQARPFLIRALSILEALPETLAVAEVLGALGEVEYNRGQLSEARDLLERASQIKSRVLGPDHPLLATTLTDLALVDWAQGDPKRALDRVLQSERMTRGYVIDSLSGLPEREALQFEDVRNTGLNLILSILCESPATSLKKTAVAVAWTVIMQSRALVLDEMADRVRTSALEGGHLATRREQLHRKKEQFARLLLQGPGRLSQDVYTQRLAQAAEAKEAAERQLAQESKNYRQRESRLKVDPEILSQALPDKTALVAYVRFGRITPIAATEIPANDSPRPHRPSPGFYIAFLMSPEQTSPVAIPLGEAGSIEMQVERWERVAGSPPSGSPSNTEGEEDYRRIAEQLKHQIWDPITPHLGQVRTVFIVPDGALNVISFATLPSGDGYIATKGPRVHYLSTERDLVQEPLLSKGRGLLALGGPDFDTEPGASKIPIVRAAHVLSLYADQPRSYRGDRAECDVFESLRFLPLPSTELEVKDISRIWQEKFPEERDVVQLIGSRAGEAAFKRLAGSKETVHLATHGFFLGGRCWSTLSESRQGASSMIERRGAMDVVAENPLLLNGLALAGANRRHDQTGTEMAEDGILTAEEIAALDLSNVRWAVLSACATGLGEIQAGEGVLGLRRAFATAGVRTLIMSLWNVDDASTRSWMRELYRARFDGRSTVGAVYEASKRIIHERQTANLNTHPFYWGGFVSVGDSR